MQWDLLFLGSLRAAGVKFQAEGVETASQVDFLKGSRCDVFQGHYFAKPIPYETLEIFLSIGMLNGFQGNLIDKPT